MKLFISLAAAAVAAAATAVTFAAYLQPAMVAGFNYLRLLCS